MTSLPLILTLAGAGVYAAYRNPNLGAALLVGLAIFTALYVVLSKDSSVVGTTAPGYPSAAPVPDPQTARASPTPAAGFP